jgi:hypothetical protein
MQPINYGVEIQDPSQSFLSAFQTGASIQDMRAKQEQQQQQIANQRLVQEGFAKLRQPGATAADYANLAMVLPETQAKAVRESFNMLSGERQQNALQQSGQIFSALKSGKPEIAIGLIDRQIEAKRNSGDEEGAKFLETWRDVTKENPKATEDYFGFTISQMPGGDKVIESSVKLGGERRAEAQAPAELRQKNAVAGKAESDAQIRAEEAKNIAAVIKADLEKKAADLGLTKAQTGSALAQSKKLGVETAKAVLELEALKASGGVDPAKTFDQEEKLRKEFQTRTKTYQDVNQTYQTLKASSNAKSGPGDIALITGFMKMLDPGSVVRETEFATARDTAGLYTRLENSLQKANNGEFLKPAQRDEFVKLANEYYKAAQKKADEDKRALGVVVKNYKLNPENVFGAEEVAPPQPPSAGGGRGFVNPPAPQQRNVTVNY